LQDCDPASVIAFLGTVGSGKSTQMRLLSYRLRKDGLRVKTATLKTNHILARLLTLVLVSVLENCRKKVYPLRTLIEDEPKIFGALFNLWLALDMLSFSFKFLVTVLLPRKFGHIVIVEEYIPATICDYMYLHKALNLPGDIPKFATEFLLRLLYVGGPMQAIFLDARQNTLQSRWKNRNTAEERPEYLVAQRSKLLVLTEKLSAHNVLFINTSDRKVIETHEMLVNFLAKQACVKQSMRQSLSRGLCR
jgi:broad-specificity NMP kinase